MKQFRAGSTEITRRDLLLFGNPQYATGSVLADGIYFDDWGTGKSSRATLPGTAFCSCPPT